MRFSSSSSGLFLSLNCGYPDVEFRKELFVTVLPDSNESLIFAFLVQILQVCFADFSPTVLSMLQILLCVYFYIN